MQLFRRALPLASALALAFPMLSGSGFAQNPLQVRPQVRVTSTVDNKARTQLAGGLPRVLSRATETGRLNGAIRMNHMLLVLQPGADQEQALRTLTDQQNEKGSANFQKWITPAQFGQSFGLSDSDIAAVTGWLQSQGMTIDQVTPGKRLIEFSGSVAQVETAFGTEMHSYSVAGEKHVSANSSITVPTALAGVIASVPTLHDFFKKSYMTKPTTAVAPISRFPALAARFPGAVADAGTHPELTSGTTHYFGAIDFQTVYNTAPLINGGNNGAGVTIGVIGRTDIGLNDVQIYRTVFGLPNNDPTFTVVGEDPGVVAGDDGESYLDVEVSGGVAPGAKINFIASKATLTTDGVDLAAIYAVQNNGVDIITESYGQCEADFAGTSVYQFYQDLWGQAAAQGISVFVSSGDNGPASCDSDSSTYESDGYAVSLLASSPFNVAVGGSNFFEGTGTYWSTTNGAGYESALSYIPEQPWNESYKNSQGYAELCGLCSGSGGVSAYFPTPSWQRGPGVPTADPAYPFVTTSDPSTPYTTGPHRYLPDVALNAAGGHDGTIYCAEGVCQITATGIGFGVVGGTSVAAPSMAGVQALVDAANGGRQGNPNFHYYALAIANSAAGLNCASTGPPATGCVFNDITTGNTIICGNSSCAAANKIGWTAAAGYDLASGLGSVNVANLATQWSTVSFTSSVTSLTLTPSAGLTHGQSVTVTLTVAPGVGGTGTPTGQVGVFASQGALTNPTNPNTGGFLNQPAYCTLSGGTCTISLGSLPAGTYNLYARYSGDPTYGASTSTSVPLSVAKEGSTTTFAANTFSCTTGAINPTNAIVYGTAVYLDTTVAGASGQGVPTGKISLLDTGAALTSVALNGTGNSELIAGAVTTGNGQSCVYGYANPNLASLTGGVHSITVNYPGDTNFGSSSTANAYVLTVTPASLTSNLKSTAVGTASGGSTTLTFYMSPLDASAMAVNATGTVTFTDTTSGTVLGTATIARGLYSNANYFLATLTTTGITLSGANTISAIYSGDTNYASTTATTTVTVGTLSTITTGAVTSTSTTPTVAATNTLTFTASAYSGAAPSGTVAFYDNGTTLLGSGTLSTTTHTATLATRTILGAGTHNITGVYSGSTTYAGYTSPVLTLVVAKATPTVNVSVKAGTILGSTATLTVLITVPESTTYVAYIPPTGTVQYYDNGNPLGSPVALTPPVTYANGGYGLYEAVLNTTALTIGSNAITATFTDSNYATTTTNSETVTISQFTPGLTVSSPATVYAKGAAITFSAVLTVPAGVAAPTGLIGFFDGNTSLGSGPLTASGTGMYAASLGNVTTLAAGPHSITAQYLGDTNYTAITSAAIPEIITTNNIWVANGNGTVSAVSEGGTPVTPSAVSGGGKAIAIDNAGDVWSLNTSSVAEFSNTGTVISAGYTGGGLSNPTALTIDGAGYVWVTNASNTISVLGPTGAPFSTTPYTSLLSAPTTVNVDGSGNLWITNSGDNSVTEVIGVAAPVTTPQTTAVKNSSVAARP